MELSFFLETKDKGLVSDFPWSHRARLISSVCELSTGATFQARFLRSDFPTVQVGKIAKSWIRGPHRKDTCELTKAQLTASARDRHSSRSGRYELLDTVRDPEIWREIKRSAKEVGGGQALGFMKDLATAYAKHLVKEP
ncbi:MAG: hypothetical protein K0S56_2780 [Microvirga sp.]|nr:hypothetical protein [Microvirga sp.]